MKKLINGIANTLSDPIGRTTVVGYSTTMFLITAGLILAGLNYAGSFIILIIFIGVTGIGLCYWHATRKEDAAAMAVTIGGFLGGIPSTLLIIMIAPEAPPEQLALFRVFACVVASACFLWIGMTTLFQGWGVEDPKH